MAKRYRELQTFTHLLAELPNMKLRTPTTTECEHQHNRPFARNVCTLLLHSLNTCASTRVTKMFASLFGGWLATSYRNADEQVEHEHADRPHVVARLAARRTRSAQFRFIFERQITRSVLLAGVALGRRVRETVHLGGESARLQLVGIDHLTVFF